MMITYLLAAFCFVSICLNIAQIFILKKSKKAKVDSYELREFLADIQSGSGYLEVKRIDPSGFLLRNPSRF